MSITEFHDRQETLRHIDIEVAAAIERFHISLREEEGTSRAVGWRALAFPSPALRRMLVVLIGVENRVDLFRADRLGEAREQFRGELGLLVN